MICHDMIGYFCTAPNTNFITFHFFFCGLSRVESAKNDKLFFEKYITGNHFIEFAVKYGVKVVRYQGMTYNKASSSSTPSSSSPSSPPSSSSSSSSPSSSSSSSSSSSQLSSTRVNHVPVTSRSKSRYSCSCDIPL